MKLLDHVNLDMHLLMKIYQLIKNFEIRYFNKDYTEKVSNEISNISSITNETKSYDNLKLDELMIHESSNLIDKLKINSLSAKFNDRLHFDEYGIFCFTLLNV